MESLNPEEVARYARHFILPEVGTAGQAKLKSSSVLLVGLGGLGSPVAMYLAAAGIGRLGLIDQDRVDLSNLQRQIIHTTARLGEPKIKSAAEAINALNPHVAVDCYDERFESSNGLQIAANYDILIDGTDNFATRYLVNDASVLLGKPNCYGSVFRFEGQASLFGNPGGPCYRCVFPAPPPPHLAPSCAEAGVLGVLPGMIGTIQAAEAIKVLLGIDSVLSGRLLLVDAMRMQFRELQVQQNPQCPVCGESPTIKELVPFGEATCETDATAAVGTESEELSVHQFFELRDSGKPYFLLDVRESFEQEICSLGGELIPLKQLVEQLDALPADIPLVVHCKSGGRSAKAVAMLKENGFKNAVNLTGGILAWAAEFDQEMRTY